MTTKDHSMTIRLTKAERKALEKVADEKGVSVGELVRKGIRLVLDPTTGESMMVHLDDHGNVVWDAKLLYALGRKSKRLTTRN